MSTPLFERFLAETKPDWRRRFVVVGSLAAHGLLALGLLVWSIFHVEEIAPPTLPLTYFITPAAPPPAAAGSGKRRSAPERAAHGALIQPMRIPPKPPADPTSPPRMDEPTPESATEADEGKGDDGEGEGGDGPGEPGGAYGGVPNGVPGGIPGGSPHGATQPHNLGGFQLQALQLDHPVPHLPAWYTSRHPHEAVKGLYRVCVGPDGRIGEVTVLSGIAGVDAQIMDYIRSNWTYRPQRFAFCGPSQLVFEIN